jgi:hypothetical protein
VRRQRHDPMPRVRRQGLGRRSRLLLPCRQDRPALRTEGVHPVPRARHLAVRGMRLGKHPEDVVSALATPGHDPGAAHSGAVDGACYGLGAMREHPRCLDAANGQRRRTARNARDCNRRRAPTAGRLTSVPPSSKPSALRGRPGAAQSRQTRQRGGHRACRRGASLPSRTRRLVPRARSSSRQVVGVAAVRALAFVEREQRQEIERRYSLSREATAALGGDRVAGRALDSGR